MWRELGGICCAFTVIYGPRCVIFGSHALTHVTEQHASKNRLPVHGLRMTLGLALHFFVNHILKRDSVANIRLLKAEQYKNDDTILTQAAFDALLLENDLVLCGSSMAPALATRLPLYRVPLIHSD